MKRRVKSTELVVRPKEELESLREELKFPSQLARSTLQVGIKDQREQQITALQTVAHLTNEVKKSEKDLSEFKKGAPYFALGLGLIVLSAFAASAPEGLLVLLLMVTGPGLIFGLKALQHYLNKKDKNHIGLIGEEMEVRSELLDGMQKAIKELPETKIKK